MLLNTDLLTLSEAAKRCPVLRNDRTKSPGSKSRPETMRLWRWCRVGILARDGRRVRLNHYKVGGRLAVTEADLLAFFKATADADAEHFAVAPADVPLTSRRNLKKP